MRINKKRLVSILLAMVMALTLFFAAPMTVFGAMNETAGDDVEFGAALTNVDDGGTITLTGSFTYDGQVILNSKNLIIDLDGNTLTINGSGAGAAVFLENSSLLTVKGPGILNATTNLDSCVSVDNSLATIESEAIINVYTGVGAFGAVQVKNGGMAIVTTATTIGDNTYGVQVDGAGSSVIVDEDISVTGLSVIGAQAGTGGTIIVNGSVTAAGNNSYGASASGAGSTIIVNGSVNANGSGAKGAQAGTDGIIIVNGSITASGSNVDGVYASGGLIEVGSTITVNGSGSFGAYADNGGEVSAFGDIRVAGPNSTGVKGRTGGTVYVWGNIFTDGLNSTGACGSDGTVHAYHYIIISGTGSFGAIADSGGEVFVDDAIVAPNNKPPVNGYIKIETNAKTISDFAPVTTRIGYLEYTDNVSYVRVNGMQDVLNNYITWNGSGPVAFEIKYDRYTDFSWLEDYGSVVPPAGNFTVTSGSTIITLSEAFLRTLDNGEHQFAAHFKSGAWAYLNLIVNNTGTPVTGTTSSGNNVPQTDDTNNTLGWTVVLALVFLGIFGLVFRRRST